MLISLSRGDLEEFTAKNDVPRETPRTANLILKLRLALQ